MHQHANKKSSTFLRDIPVSSRPPSKNLFTQIIWANAHQAGKLHQSESLCTGDRPNPWVVIHLLARDLAVLDQRWVTRALRKSYFLEVTQLRETGLGNLTINWQLKKMGRPAEIVHSVFADTKMYRGKQVMKSKRPILTFASKTSNSFTKSFSGWFSMFFL